MTGVFNVFIGFMIKNPTNPQDNAFRDFILCKIVNGQHAAYNASKFKIMIERTRHQMLGK